MNEVIGYSFKMALGGARGLANTFSDVFATGSRVGDTGWRSQKSVKLPEIIEVVFNGEFECSPKQNSLVIE